MAVLNLLDDKLIEWGALPDLWERVYPWLIIFDALKDHTPEHAIGNEQFVALLGLIAQSGNNRVVDKVRSSPRLVYLIGRVWKDLIEKENRFSLSQLALPFGIYSGGHGQGLVSDNARAQLLEAADGDHLKLATLIVGHLRLTFVSADTPATHEESIMASVALSILKPFTDDLDLRNALLRRGIVPELTRMIYIVSITPPLVDRDSGVQMNLEDAFSLLLSTFCELATLGDTLRGRSHVFMAQSLRNGLLQAMASCAKSKEYKHIIPTHLHGLLSAMLPRQLVYHSVLAELKPCVGILETMRSEFGQVAEDCERHATQYLGYYTDFHSAERVRLRACANPECTTITNKNKLKKCGGCTTTLYCSSSCQKRDWRSGHRNFCSQLHQMRDAAARKLGSVNVSFFRFLLRIEVEKQKSQISTETFQSLGADTPSVPCVVFDFTRGQCVVEVSPSSFLSWLNAPAELLRWMHKSRGRVQLHVLRINPLTMRYRDHDPGVEEEIRLPAGDPRLKDPVLHQLIFPFYVSDKCAKFYNALQDFAKMMPADRQAAMNMTLSLQPLMIAALNGYMAELANGSY
ncbi:hypothetical protein C8F01DRAFT_1224543 [Mycena amicta]|nr:hypothetical protein C8F01DRAFT_1224543 [Mycena amicta]